jgi:single-strand DNA-binding protein
MNNVIILEGNIGRDPEHRSTKSGGDIVTTSMAVYRSKEKSDWFNIKVFSASLGKELLKAKKGDKLAVIGRCEINEWEKDGVKRTSVDIIADSVRVLPKRESGMVHKGVDTNLPF